MKAVFAAVATLGVAAHAFLLPPEVSEADIAMAAAIPAHIFPVPVDTALVELPCPGCPVQVKNRHGKVHVKTNKQSHLNLLFKVEQQPDAPDRLVLNGFTIYPKSDPFHESLFAPQTIDRHHTGPIDKPKAKHHKVHKEQKEHKGHKGPVHHEVISPKLGFSLQTMESKAGTPQSAPDIVADFDTIALELQIIEVAGQFINGIPTVEVRVLKDANGHLNLADVHLRDSSPLKSTPLSVPESSLKDCKSPLCQWLAFIEGKIGRPFGGCANKNKHHGQQGQALQSHHKFRPDRFRHPHQRTWGQLLRNLASHILLPVLIGIVAGVGASLLGMLVGSFIVLVWRAMFRRGHARCRHACRHKAASKEAAVAEEKAGLMEQQSPPPAYEEEEEEAAPKEETPMA
ncbi:hypothetical protein GQ53DRAFT_753469 [Thozetella sp. PMI_491]|nr:hypothetical protein GQ53DRAFT_753469 [Thozetella sp. PMI_491]